MSDKTGKIKMLYVELYHQEKRKEYESALNTVNRILKAAPEDSTAVSCKIVCFIHLTRFFDALSLTAQLSELSISPKTRFEEAYCQYRINNHVGALKIIEQIQKLGYRERILRAQIFYRLEKFDEAFKLYQDLNKTPCEYEDQLAVNIYAAKVYVDTKEVIEEIEGEENYEESFNGACQLISLERFEEAEQKLHQCEEMCRNSLDEDGITHEEIETELTYIKIQLGFVLQKQGRNDEAQAIYTHALKLKLKDEALNAVCCNNLVVINDSQSIFSSMKKMKIAMNKKLDDLLVSDQRKRITLNNAILNYHSNQLELCKKNCRELKEIWPELLVKTVALEALILVKDGRYDDAFGLIENCLARNQKDFLYLQLLNVQFRLMHGDHDKACEILENLNDLNKYRLGIVAALITLYRAKGEERLAQHIYGTTVDWYKTNKRKRDDLFLFWRQAANFHIENNQYILAANCLEELLRTNPKDKKITAELVLVYAKINANKAIQLASELFTMREIASYIDVETVESSAWLLVARNSPVAKRSFESLDDILTKKKTKQRRKRRGKLPKNYDATVMPDPERWLPRCERSSGRKRRELDFSKVMVVESETQDENSGGVKNQQRNKGAIKKKRKK